MHSVTHSHFWCTLLVCDISPMCNLSVRSGPIAKTRFPFPSDQSGVPPPGDTQICLNLRHHIQE